MLSHSAVPLKKEVFGTLRFRRDQYVASIQAFLLFIYFLAMLYFLGVYLHSSGQQCYLGLSALFLWTVVIVVWDVRLLLFCMDRIEFNDEGIRVRHLLKETVYPWSRINEAERRKKTAMSGQNARPEQVVLSTVVLSDPIRKKLCSDVEPWLFQKQLLEFDLGWQKKKSEIRLWLIQHSELFAEIAGSTDVEGLSIATKDGTRGMSYSNLAFFSLGSDLFSFLRFAEDGLWFLALSVTKDWLSQPVIRWDAFPKGFWIACWSLTLLRIIRRICIKYQISKLSKAQTDQQEH